MVWGSLGAFLANSKWAVMWLVWPDWWSVAEMVVLLEGPPISTEELWSSVSDHRVLGYLPDQGSSPPIAQFGQVASFRKSLDGSKRFPFKNDGGHCSWIFNDAEMFWYPSLALCLDTILSRSSTDNSFDVMSWFLLWHAPVNCGTLYRQVCAFPNHAQSIEFPQVDSNQVIEISQGWSMGLEIEKKKKSKNSFF